jgi:Replication-relaxation
LDDAVYFATPFAPPFQRETALGAIAPGSRPSVAPDIPRSTQPYSFLPHTTPSVLRTVALFRQATSSQLRRLHYTGTRDGTRVRSRKHLARLVALNKLRRIWDVYEGVAEFIYLPPESKARAANMHTLDVTELYVQLMENQCHIRDATNMVFDPEPWRYYSVGPTDLRPDAYIDVGRRYFLEMDEGTEYRAALAKKMGLYVAAFRVWGEERFPQVMFVCHDQDRFRFIAKIIQRQSKPKLFSVCLFSRAVDVLEVTGVSRTKPL